MAKANEDGYKALYGAAAFNANRETGEGVPIETFVIPDCYTDIDEGAAELARIRHLVVGSGMQRIHAVGLEFLSRIYVYDGQPAKYVREYPANDSVWIFFAADMERTNKQVV